MNALDIAAVASVEKPLYANKAEFRAQIDKAKEPEQLNAVLDNFKKGKSNPRIHQLSDADCAHVWNMMKKRGRELGFTQRGSDHTFYKPLNAPVGTH